MLFKWLVTQCVLTSFVLSLAIPMPFVQAQSALNLPVPGTMITVSPPFNPAVIKGITLYPENPLKFDFIIDPGDDNLQGNALRKEANKLIKYFMASLTVPEDEMWVNLSPYEKDRIIANGLSQTELGRDLLTQDYILKQVTASLMYPEEDLGKEFWQKVYAEAQARYGTSEIPMNTFNKVWIIPEKANVHVNGNNIFVVDNYLKVMLEEDYLALESNLGHDEHGVGKISENQAKEINDVSSEVVREIIIPAIEKEVNEGKNFATLRQIFNSMILATWYKQNLRKSLIGQVYVNQNKVKGIDLEDKTAKEMVYQRYVESFEKGVYDFIKEDYDEATQQIIARKYFSGGIEGIQKRVGARTLRSDERTAILDGNESLYSVEFSRVEHEALHGMAGIQSTLNDLYDDLNEVFEIEDRDGEYDFRGAVETNGRINHSHGYLELAPDGVLIIVDERFQFNHAGRNRRVVYARSSAEVKHKLEELRLWETFVVSQNIMTQEQVQLGQMGARLVQWVNAGDAQIRLDNQNLLIKTYFTNLAAGLKIDGRQTS